MLLAVGLVLVATVTAMAKGDAVVTLDAPLPADPEPGSTLTIGWTLDIPDGAGSTVPFDSEGVFVRFTPLTGTPLEVMARQDRVGHYRATVTVPDGGLGRAVFGLKGESCFAGGGCERSDMFFRLATDARAPAPDPVAAPVVPVATVAPAVQPPVAALAPTTGRSSPAAGTLDLAWLPPVALVGLAATALVLLVRKRGRTAAA
jgi:hypothetical protein